MRSKGREQSQRHRRIANNGIVQGDAGERASVEEREKRPIGRLEPARARRREKGDAGAKMAHHMGDTASFLCFFHVADIRPNQMSLFMEDTPSVQMANARRQAIERGNRCCWYSSWTMGHESFAYDLLLEDARYRLDAFRTGPARAKGGRYG